MFNRVIGGWLYVTVPLLPGEKALWKRRTSSVGKDDHGSPLLPGRVTFTTHRIVFTPYRTVLGIGVGPLRIPLENVREVDVIDAPSSVRGTQWEAVRLNVTTGLGRERFVVTSGATEFADKIRAHVARYAPVRNPRKR